MKKFVVGFLCMFMLFGGVLLTSCGQSVSLSCDVDEVVTLYTNDTSASSSATVYYSLKNSSAGVRIDVLSGQDCISVGSVTSRGNDSYSFSISALSSGQSVVRITSVEDTKQQYEISVQVNTLVEEISAKAQTTTKSSLYVIKGGDGTALDNESYINFSPITANITDVEWYFEPTSGENSSLSAEYYVNGVVAAYIENGTLYVKNNFNLSSVQLRALYSRNSSVYTTVTFDVLENSTINSLTLSNYLGATTVIEDETLNENALSNGVISFDLKRNNAEKSTLTGTLVVNSQYAIELNPSVYNTTDGVWLSDDDAESFVEVSTITSSDNTTTYIFSIDAQNLETTAATDFYVYLEIAYAAYTYSISTQDFGLSIEVCTSFAVTKVELTNASGDILNNQTVDVFSSYSTTDSSSNTSAYGYALTATLQPDDVPLDNSYFYIQIETDSANNSALSQALSEGASLSDIIKITYQNQNLSFENSASSTTYTTRNLASGVQLYIMAGSAVSGSLEGVTISFVSCSDGQRNTTLVLNLYEITENGSLTVKNPTNEQEYADGEVVAYMSSASNSSSRSISLTMRVEGLSSTSGLSLNSNSNDHFTFSEISEQDSYIGDEFTQAYVEVSFTVTLSGSGFEDSISFWFEHITGKKSGSFVIEAFVPSTSVAVSNASSTSASVYLSQTSVQSFVLQDGQVTASSISNSTLSRVLVETGSYILLNFEYQSLSDDGISFKYLSYENALAYWVNELGNSADSFDLSSMASLYGYFSSTQDYSTLFTISTSSSRLTVLDEFHGFIAILFEGYDESHNQITLVRFFEVESLYGVDYLSSDVKQTTLYTQETLSESEVTSSYVDVTISLRSDSQTPSHLSSSYITFTTSLTSDGNFSVVNDSNDQFSYYDNGIYRISNISTSRTLKFRITAITTNGAAGGSLSDRLSIEYNDGTIVRTTEIQLSIVDMQRVEEVTWINQTEDGEIYLNLTSSKTSEQSATISTNINPSSASNRGLSYVYVASQGSANDLIISTNENAQTFTIAMNASTGSSGYLYILPQDMVKSVDGISQVLYYTYDDNDNLVATYTPLSKLGEIYQYLIGNAVSNVDGTTTYEEVTVGGVKYANYFLNIDGEKVYYTQILLKIKVTIADGSSEGLAIRIYNSTEFATIDTGLCYEIMNDLTLTNWTSFSSISSGGMIFGTDSSITINLKGQSLIKTNYGTIKNLTFTGAVSNSGSNSAVGFVAGENYGTIDNITIDVQYSSNTASASEVSGGSADAVGAVAGVNHVDATISNCYALGVKISLSDGSLNGYLGGICGQNYGAISGCGVEFYNFSTVDGGKDFNTFIGGAYTGGITGLAGSASQISQSFVYAHPLANTADAAYSNVISGSGITGIFAGSSISGAKIEESFGFIGNLSSIVGTGDVSMTNSYITYYVSGSGDNIKYTTTIYATSNQYGSLTSTSDTLSFSLDSSIWATGDEIDKNVNFGYVHLLNVTQNVEVDVDDLILQNVTSANGYTKALKVEDLTGILFNYQVTTTANEGAEASALTNLNTISLVDLFVLSSDSSSLTQRQASTLVLSTESTALSLGANSIVLNGTTSSTITVSVRSKIDFSKSATFTFVVLQNMPTLTATLSGGTISDGESLLLQKNSDFEMILALDSTIYLSGSLYKTVSTDYSIVASDVVNSDASQTTYISTNLSGSTSATLYVETKTSHESGEYSSMSVYMQNGAISSLSGASDFNSVIEQQDKITFSVQVYDGATDIKLQNSSTSISFKPSEYGVVNATLFTDSTEDNLTFTISYNGTTFSPTEAITAQSTSASFEIDDNLTLQVLWTQTASVTNSGSYQNTYHIVIQVATSSLPLITSAYSDMTFSISALSNSSLLQQVSMSISAQEVEDVAVRAYSISSKTLKNSTTYYAISTSGLYTLSPASDAIIAVTVSPAYSQMDSFTITYSSTGSSTGSVLISRLAYSSLYGYYATSNNVTSISNGIKVAISQSDRAGDGVYYFRIYVSSAFEDDSDIKITTTFYNGTQTTSRTLDLSVDYMASATVKVGGASNYLLAKGSSATVSITVGIEQKVSSLYLQNAVSGIELSSMTETDVGDKTHTYTATLFASVDSEISAGTTGVFYVCASVSRTLNGTQEIKISTATVYLVNFSIDSSGTSVASSGSTITYNGQAVDVFTTYIGATETLRFNYTLLPSSYTYSNIDTTQTAAVQQLEEEKEKFVENGYYADENAGYYINYSYNSDTLSYSPLSIKQQLSYATSFTDSSAIYNSNYDTVVQNDIFSIYESDLLSNAMQVTGKTSGRQLMKLTTTVIYQGTEITYDYYFFIVVAVWSDEEVPTQITTAEEFVDYLTNSEEADDYILMNDITLTDYTPLDTDLVSSLDGNGYMIHINSFAASTDSTLNLALFDTVAEDTTLKNIKVNIYQGGQISVDYTSTNVINVAGFALTNNGVIYNCEVVSFKSDQQTTTYSTNGIVISYTNGSGMDAVELTSSMISTYGISSNVAGFVLTNNSSITNSRVGGAEFDRIVEIGGTTYIQTESLGTFTIQAQGSVAGFVLTNSGYVSASYAKQVQITNQTASNTTTTAGFVLTNSGQVQTSYIEGVFSDETGVQYVANLTNISSIGYIGGFVYVNSGTVKNSYSNIAIGDGSSRPSSAAGFVLENQTNGKIESCYSACSIDSSDINQMYFSGIDDDLNSLNSGSITNCYFYGSADANYSTQTSLVSGVVAIDAEVLLAPEESLYGFNFTSGEELYDGIWQYSSTHGLTLASANKRAISNRYAVTLSTGVTNFYYNKTLTNVQSLEVVNIAYGSENNPIIIRDAYDFAVATDSTTKEVSSYAEYYTDSEVFGAYRIVNNIDMSEIDQNVEGDGAAKLKTTTKTFSGILDGNGFTISNISLGSEDNTTSYGLFAELDGAIIMNLDLIVDSVNNSKANVVGTLAGIAVDSKIIGISITPSSTSSSKSTSILGGNIVGGVVGILYGESTLFDISAEDIIVYSSFKGGDDNGVKTPYSNTTYLENMQSALASGLSIANYASKLSYAGAIVGFVDITDDLNPYVIYETSYTMADYDIVSVAVSGSVTIYAEVAGGLFGYVGSNTYVYDATLEIGSENSSYIISKNLYAGGIVGENYGALAAVSVAYDDETQAAIEDSEYSYYNSGNGTFGQSDIFSTKLYSDDDMPLYIGGIAGYMAGGYIYVAYSKINIISSLEEITLSDGSTRSTNAVGGIIGLAGYSANSYTVDFALETPTTTMLLYEVYASGDAYSLTGSSGGIIGQIGYYDSSVQNSSSAPIVTMKNVMAMNFYSYTSSTGATSYVLSGDSVSTDADDGGTYLDNHAMLVGLGKNNVAPSTLYVVSYAGEVKNVLAADEGWLTSGGSYKLTVGGYSSVTLRNSSTASTTLNLRTFGFKVDGTEIDGSDGKYIEWQANTSYNTNSTSTQISDLILQAQSISTISSNADAYVLYYTYFISNGWQVKYWNHTQDDLFPHIELLQATPEIVYWDAYAESTNEVINAVEQNPNITIIVRGRTSSLPSDEDFTDINVAEHLETLGLSATAASSSILKTVNFSGTLISYAEYYHDYNQTITTLTSGGGEIGEQPGLIIDSSLFYTLASATIQGVNIYMNADSGDEITYSFVKNSTEDGAIFRDMNFVLNSDVSITATRSGSNAYAGLIAPEGKETSFVDCTITARATTDTSSGYKSANITITSESTVSKDAYFGVLFGSLTQTTSSSPMTISGFALDGGINLTIDTTNLTDASLHVGLYAGKIAKESGGTARVNVETSTLDGLSITIGKAGDQGSVNNLYVGGFFGYGGSINNLTHVAAEESENVEEDCGISITINCSVGSGDSSKLKAGLIAGTIPDGTTPFTSSTTVDLIGAIYQDSSSKIKAKTYIGALAGTSSAVTSVSSFCAKLTVCGSSFDYESKETFTSFATSYETQPFVNLSVSDSSLDDTLQTAVGGVFGLADGGSVVFSGTINISGTIDVASAETAVGGLVGKTTSSISSSATITNTQDVSVQGLDASSSPTEAGTVGNAYIGGLIGEIYVPSTTDSDGNTVNGSIQIVGTSYSKITGTTIAGVSILDFGGAIGLIMTKDTCSITIKNVAYGGAVKAYGSGLSSGQVAIGGILGNDQSNSASSYTSKADYTDSISGCLTYGDAFVIYPDGKTYLSTYYFGGIIGKGTGYKIYSNSTIMSNFNSRYTAGNGYHVAAIVGSEESNLYGLASGVEDAEVNYYSSAVMMTYQEDYAVKDTDDTYILENVDLAYGSAEAYSGYTNLVGGSDYDYLSAQADYSLTTTTDILTKFSALSIDGLVSGEKLCPATLGTSENNPTFVISSNSSYTKGILNYAEISVNSSLSSTHGIYWVAVSEANLSLTLESTDSASLASVFKNTVLVGNGQTITLTDERQITGGSSSNIYGGLVDQMGSSSSDDVSFQAITSLVVDCSDDYSVDINFNGNGLSSGAATYGAIAGQTYGDSLIYGVGVVGSLSVGGENTALSLGGIVGTMSGGMISDSYTDATISYRASCMVGIDYVDTYGAASGIANIATAPNLVKNTYSSGLLQDYVNVPLYTFAHFTDVEVPISGTTYIVDCYSITQTNRTDTTSTSSVITSEDGGIYFVDVDSSDLKIIGGFYSCTSSITDTTYSSSYSKSSSDMALGYGDSPKSTDSISQKNGSASASTWYFSPYLNYGFAVHGFGWLKNVSTYTRTISNADEYINASTGEYDDELGSDCSTVIAQYTYGKVAYETILQYGYDSTATVDTTNVTASAYLYTPVDENDATKTSVSGISDSQKWLLGVPSVEKFQQMISLITKNSSSYTKAYRFVLMYDLDMSEMTSSSYGAVIGQANYDLIIDGANVTLDFSFTETSYTADTDAKGGLTETYTKSSGSTLSSSIFSIVIGNIENMNISNINVGGDTVYGTLAASVLGNLTNITVSGNLASSAEGGTVYSDVTTAEGSDGGTIVTGGTKNTSISESGLPVIGAVGGVVGEITGVVTGVESVVNVTLSKANIAGGVVGALLGESSKILYSSNSGEIVSAVENGDSDYAAYQARFTAISDDGETLTADLGKTSADKSIYNTFNTVVGGVVGYVYGGSVENSYNTNSVLANYTNDSSHNSVAGGIVGYIDGGAAENLTSSSISNCANTGLVGAGNYSSTSKYVYAGGIFGYAVNMPASSISSNANDGSVEAISKSTSGSTSGTTFAMKYFKYYSYLDPDDNSTIYDKDTVFVSDSDTYSTYIKLLKATESNSANKTIYYFTISGSAASATFTYNGCKTASDSSSTTPSGVEGFVIDETSLGSFASKDYVVLVSPAYYKVSSLGYSSGSSLNSTSQKEKMSTYAYNNIASLCYDYTIIYNPSSNREVYAYGIGYVGSIDIDGSTYEVSQTSTDSVVTSCTTSTDNITNDGNIGQANSETQTLTFDRQKVLDNGNGTLDFWGMFAVSGDTYVNGYDSYGFPVRLYRGDTITRVYLYASSDVWISYSDGAWSYSDISLSSETGHINPIMDAYISYYKPDKIALSHLSLIKYNGSSYNADTYVFSASNKYPLMVTNYYLYYKGTSSGYDTDRTKAYNDATAFNYDEFLLKDSTEYYQSITFGTGEDESSSVYGYDYILATGNGTGVGAYNSASKTNEFEANGNKSSTDSDAGDSSSTDSAANVDNLIEDIDAKLETTSTSKTIQVDGESVAIVSNSDQFIAAVAPVVYTGSATFSEVALDDVVGEPTLTCSSDKMVYYTTTVSGSTSSVTVEWTAYCSSEVDGSSFSVSLNYMKTEGITIGNNNLIVSDDTAYLILKQDSDEGEYVIGESILQSISGNEGTYTISSVAGYTSGYTLSTYNSIYALKITNANLISALQSATTATIVWTEKVSTISSATATLSTGSGSVSGTFDSTMKVEKTISFPVTTSDVSVSSLVSTLSTGTTTGTALSYINLSDISDVVIAKTVENNSIAIGDPSDNYKFYLYYKAGVWTGENLGTTYSIETDSNGDYLLCVASDFEDFKTAFTSFTAYYYSNIDALSYGAVFSDTTETKLTDNVATISLTYTKSADDPTSSYDFDFGSYCKYSGDEDLYTYASSCGLSYSKDDHFGMTFVTSINVPFTAKYNVSTVSVKASKTGYELTIAGTTYQGYYLSSSKKSDEIDVSGFSGDSISISLTYHTTTQTAVDSYGNTVTATDYSFVSDTNTSITLTYSDSLSSTTYTYTVTTGSGAPEELDTTEIFTGSNFSGSDYSTVCSILSSVASTTYYKTSYVDDSTGWTYYTYKNGVSVVCYYSESTSDSTQYVIYLQSGSSIYQVNYTATIDDETEISDSSCASYSGSDDPFSTEDDSLTYLTVDLIVAYFDADNVLFARNNTGGALTTTKTNTAYTYEQSSVDMSVFFTDGISSTYTNDVSFTATQTEENGEDVTGSTEQSTYNETDKKYYISTTDYGTKKYNVTYQSNAQVACSNVSQTSAEKTVATLMILTDTIHMQNGLSSNSVDIVGNNQVYKYVSSSSSESSAFGANSGDITSLTVSGAVNLRGATTSSASMLVSSNTGAVLNNIKLYGNIRNVATSVTESGTTAGMNVYVVTSAQLGTNMLNVTSYVSVTGLDGENGASVSSVINDYATKEIDDTDPSDITYVEVGQYTSKSILVAGDGSNGIRGAAAYLNLTDGAKKGTTVSAKKGGNAGSGGSISTGDKTSSQIFVRAGIAGIAGYGGNGLNGYEKVSGDEANSYSSASGMKEGSSSEAGEVSGNATNSDTRTICTTTYAGNGGIGRFGRVYKLDSEETFNGAISYTANYVYYTAGGTSAGGYAGYWDRHYLSYYDNQEEMNVYWFGQTFKSALVSSSDFFNAATNSRQASSSGAENYFKDFNSASGIYGSVISSLYSNIDYELKASIFVLKPQATTKWKDYRVNGTFWDGSEIMSVGSATTTGDVLS